VQTSELQRFCRLVAAVMPAILISYSALIDPLFNFDLAQGFNYGGVQVGSDQKSKFLTRIAIPGFFVLSVLLAVIARPAIPRLMRGVLIPGLSLLVLACISAIWARQPGNTFTLAAYQAILYGSLLGFVVVSGSPQHILRYMLVMFAVVVTVNMLLIIARPPGSDGHPGIYTHKNTLGAAAGCAFLFGLFSLIEGRLLFRLIAWYTTIGGFILSVASTSKTTFALMIAAPVLAVSVYLLNRLLGLGSLVSLIFLTALGIPAFLILGQVLRFDSDDLLLVTYGDTTFTGRTEIWSFVSDHIAKSPILGNGFRGFWSLGSASPKHGSEIEFIRTIGSSHSGYFDITLDLGLVGLGLLSGLIFVSIFTAGKFHIRPLNRSFLYLSVMLFVVGRNFMESVIMWSTFFDNLCFLLVGFLACYATSRRVVSPSP
jgi:exopolysaccharide production protein ExoQ